MLLDGHVYAGKQRLGYYDQGNANFFVQYTKSHLFKVLYTMRETCVLPRSLSSLNMGNFVQKETRRISNPKQSQISCFRKHNFKNKYKPVLCI